MKKYISEVSVPGAEGTVASEEHDGVLMWLAGWWNHGVHNGVRFLAGQKRNSRKEGSNFTGRVRDVWNDGYEIVKEWLK